MAKHLDLEEQEQLDQLKHLWRKYGRGIGLVAVVGALAFALWSGWQYWQGHQAQQSAALYDVLEQAVQGKDGARLERSLQDMQERFPSASYTQQAALLAAKVWADQEKWPQAQAALEFVIAKSKDEGYVALARLRLAGIQIQNKAFDAAQKQLTAAYPAAFDALLADRWGDWHMAQGQKDPAALQYRKAYLAMEANTEYRRWVQVKMAALGVSAEERSAAPTSDTAQK